MNAIMEKIKIGIIICDRYSACAGGKCFRSFMNREGAFTQYEGMDAEIYYLTHIALDTWNTSFLQRAVRDTLCDNTCRLRYD